MRRIRILAFMLLLAAPLAALAGGDSYGEGLELAEATPISDILARPHDFEGKVVRVEGPVKEVCQAMGCWNFISSSVAT